MESRARKQEMFEHLINEARKGIITGICGRYGQLKWEDSEDIFQEGSIVMWNKWNENEGMMNGKEFRSWLWGICKNIASHYIRKQRFDATLEEGMGTAENSEEDMEEKIWLLEDAMEEMNEKDRRFLNSFYVDNWSLKEIAEALSYKNELVAKNVKCRIMRRLKESYQRAEKRGRVKVRTGQTPIYPSAA